jgi:hypothetical protein
MSNPIVVELPHRLGAAEARRRIEANMGRLGQQIPGGAQVESHWTGNRLALRVQAMNQDIKANIDVNEANVRLEVVLPPALSFFGQGIAALLRNKGSAILEDKRKGS